MYMLIACLNLAFNCIRLELSRPSGIAKAIHGENHFRKMHGCTRARGSGIRTNHYQLTPGPRVCNHT